LCGLVGFIDKKARPDIINEMLKIQSYRGPDDNGVYYDEISKVHLGHNRLAIQDLSSNGHQPFLSHCENYAMVFNGEVYNFKTIRIELEILGHRFVSSSDTEVILYSYKEWGTKCVEKFIGMFALCILDKIQNKLLLVRDRAGVKPLYYYVNENQFMFSSEIKSFHKHPNFKKDQNLEVLPYFFQFGYIPAPYTIFKKCFKLEPGHFLEFSIENSTFNITKYWDVNDYYLQDELEVTEDVIVEDIENILDDAIGLRMVSDVPVGVFLSGGYDSSLVASILAKKQGKKINTFTIGFDNEEYNEAKHAKNIAKYLGTNHTEYYVKNNDILDLIKTLPFYYDEPFGDASALPLMVVSKLARQSVVVALSADGGDEAFCGYSKYFILDKFQRISSTSFKKFFFKTLLNLTGAKLAENINSCLPKNLKQSNIKEKYAKLQRAVNSETREEMFEKASSYSDKTEVAKFLKVGQNQDLFKKWGKIENIKFLKQMMAIDYKLFMNDDVLTKVDRATMSVGLEAREPLLDHRIIEYMAKVSRSIKYKNSQGKYVLRQVLYKYLPKEMVDKPKSGFTIPLNEWLRNELKPLVDKYISTDKLDHDLFHIDEIISMKDRFNSGENLGAQVWLLIMYQMWKEEWL